MQAGTWYIHSCTWSTGVLTTVETPVGWPCCAVAARHGALLPNTKLTLSNGLPQAILAST
ncbi:hypothetical protein EYF80_019560 [Liparis tanakae]|uniref:Uncharacterized protein n=1 Tax=Liparis tanakae TaxID=230148 RepID=A0A4Z2HWI5_9TELE|nr:hypothetical protein EYF80_019560 [Liparis tanakae]